MRVKQILSEVTLVIADLEVDLGGELRSSPCLCALIAGVDGTKKRVIPLNTPDGRPILMNSDNALELDITESPRTAVNPWAAPNP